MTDMLTFDPLLSRFLTEHLTSYVVTVNKNLVGVGYMSADQKKKLLWGNKKGAGTEEVYVSLLYSIVACFT